jgi:hypothetical protein
VDPENGRAKNCARNFEINIKDNHEDSLRDSKKLADHLGAHFIWPQRKLWEKAMWRSWLMVPGELAADLIEQTSFVRSR